MPKVFLYLTLFCAGFAALSWEILWQLKLSLALGFSSLGTALTLATTMGGMTIGSLLMGRYLRTRSASNPLLLYLGLEIAIGLSGLLLEPGFRLAEIWDTQLYRVSSGLAPVVQVCTTMALLGLPTLALGATIPIFNLVAKRFRCSLSWLYGLNTAGAALGCLGIAFVLLPKLGVSTTIIVVASINFCVALSAFLLSGVRQKSGEEDSTQHEVRQSPFPLDKGIQIAFVTGFSTFCLEVAWFRSFKAAFGSRTESFAIMLAAVLVALALGAHLAGRLSRTTKAGLFPGLLLAAGLAILITTPLVERFDYLSVAGGFQLATFKRFLATLGATGPAIICLGACLPWLLDTQESPQDCAKLYASNTLGAIAGSLVGAWVLIPTLGFARTSWFVGCLVGLTAIVLLPTHKTKASVSILGAFMVALFFESGIGRARIQVPFGYDAGYRIVAFSETPESTISIIETTAGQRDLVIDGFITTGDHEEMTHYMKWMGHLPMLLHPSPKNALVICFGTGQTANALIQEGAEQVDVVDLNRAVLDMAHYFPVNQGVLENERVNSIVMDGRAWMRRADKRYDVITLEPMAPTFAGVNNLYSREFYLSCKENLNEGGIVCQWLPFHLLHPTQTLKIAASVKEVFPNCGLWLDPVGYTGLLIGVKNGPPVGTVWPGLERGATRSLTDEEIRRMMVLDANGMIRFCRDAPSITDDNQDLAYGSLQLLNEPLARKKSALAMIHWASTDPPPEKPDFQELLKLRVELPHTPEDQRDSRLP